MKHVHVLAPLTVRSLQHGLVLAAPKRHRPHKRAQLLCNDEKPRIHGCSFPPAASPASDALTGTVLIGTPFLTRKGVEMKWSLPKECGNQMRLNSIGRTTVKVKG
jgi:hypothetical protein